MPVALTKEEIFRRTVTWVNNPRTRTAPVCGHDETHGRLKPEILGNDMVMSCTQCDFKELGVPFAACRKS